jgi:hypothetical protein
VLLFRDALEVAREAGTAYSGLPLDEAELVAMLQHFNSIGEVGNGQPRPVTSPLERVTAQHGPVPSRPVLACR